MERALFVTRPEVLKYWDDKYDRLYYGNEFCQELLPDKGELEKAINFALDRKIGFTLVTPFVTDRGLERVRGLLDMLPKNAEIVINDWGILRMVSKANRYKLCLGRLLTKQRRGPRITNLIGRVPKTMVERFRRSSIDRISDLLKEKGIYRIELDNLLQGIGEYEKGFRYSLYIPYVYVTTSRYCLASLSCRVKKEIGIFPCNRECQKILFELSNKNLPCKLLLKGNTQFIYNKRVPDLGDINLDRIVFQPEIPI